MVPSLLPPEARVEMKSSLYLLLNDHFKNLGWKDKQSAHQWRSVVTTAGQEHGGFEYEVIDRQLGRKGHLNGTRGHYDRSTLLEKRIELMNWWSKNLIEQGLKI